jgi:hypothetical protein
VHVVVWVDISRTRFRETSESFLVRAEHDVHGLTFSSIAAAKLSYPITWSDFIRRSATIHGIVIVVFRCPKARAHGMVLLEFWKVFNALLCEEVEGKVVPKKSFISSLDGSSAIRRRCRVLDTHDMVRSPRSFGWPCDTWLHRVSLAHVARNMRTFESAEDHEMGIPTFEERRPKTSSSLVFVLDVLRRSVM